MLKFAIATALVLCAQFAFADSISGDYRRDEQHDVFITKLTDKPNTYFVTVFLVGQNNQSCLFENEMKLASGGLVYASMNCAVGIAKDSPNSVKVVGSCPQSCTDGMSIQVDGFVKASETEAISSVDLNKGD